MVQKNDWQTHIDGILLNRLLRPIERPGVIPGDLAKRIFVRSRQFSQRLSLLGQVRGRWRGQGHLQPAVVPIVFARWAMPDTGGEDQGEPSVQPSTGSPSLSLVQGNPVAGNSDGGRAQPDSSRSSQVGAMDFAGATPVVQAKRVKDSADGMVGSAHPTGVDSGSSQAQASSETGNLRNSVNPRISTMVEGNLAGAELPVIPLVKPLAPRNPPVGKLPVNATQPSIREGLELQGQSPSELGKLGDQQRGSSRQNMSPAASSLEDLGGQQRATLPQNFPSPQPVQQQEMPVVSLAPSQSSDIAVNLSDTPMPGLTSRASLPQSSSPPLPPKPVMPVVHAIATSQTSAATSSTSPLVQPPGMGPSPQTSTVPLQALPLAISRPAATPAQGQTLSDSAFPHGNHSPPSSPAVPQGATGPTAQPTVNVTRIADQVERKIMRRLTIERERRGQQLWR